jgi:hypothetical protein
MSGDIDCIGHTDQPQEFFKNLVGIRQGAASTLLS